VVGVIGALRVDRVGNVCVEGRVVIGTSADNASGAIEEVTSTEDCATKGRPVSGLESVTPAEVSFSGMTDELGLTVRDGSTDSGNSEAAAISRDAGCNRLALVVVPGGVGFIGAGPPRALTGENGGITTGCGGVEVRAGSAGTASTGDDGIVSAVADVSTD
jgi:hypothetical protein